MVTYNIYLNLVHFNCLHLLIKKKDINRFKCIASTANIFIRFKDYVKFFNSVGQSSLVNTRTQHEK